MTVQRQVHPSADVLKAFGLGKLDDTSSAVVMDHLDQCDDCRKQVASLSGDDFLNCLRQVHGLNSTPAPAKPPASQTRIPNLPPELAANQQYDVLRELGRGGMGVVYLAKNKLMDRLEVLKVVNKTLLDRPGAVERFLREIRSAAKLNHANVVTAYSALQIGELLAFAMEYVEGDDLAQVVKSRGRLPVTNACHYVQQAAMGLQHAFEKGMVHRDIKPQNLILARESKKHIVKVLDFGLAKATREKTLEAGLSGDRNTRLVDAALTGAGQMLGTPDYIAPEQTLDAAQADIRADIYSLGCTLYYLLSGRPPFSGKSLVEVLHAHHTTEAKSLNLVRADVPESLALVVRKMMAKEPSQRYQTPAEVVQTLSAAVKPAAKGAVPKSSPHVPPPTSEKKSDAEKHVLRGETMVLSTAAAPATMTGGEAAAAVPWDALSASENKSVEARQDGAGRKRRPRAGKVWLFGAATVAVLLLALLALWASGVFTGKTANDVPLQPESPIVLVETKKTSPSATSRPQETSDKQTPPASGKGLAVHGGGIGGMSGIVQPPPASPRPPAKSNEPMPPVPAPLGASEYDLTGGYRFVHFGKDKTRVVLRFNDDKQKQYFARVYDLATGQALTPPLKHEAWVNRASFSPDGQRVVTASADKTARLWDADTGKEVAPPFKHARPVKLASFSPDGRRVVTDSSDNTARLWDAATGKQVTPSLPHHSAVFHASFSPDGRRVVTASYDNTARLWDAATGKLVTPSLTHKRYVLHASFSPDGKRVVTASADNTARVWDAATGRSLTPPLTHYSSVVRAVTPPPTPYPPVFHASFSPDGQRVVTASGSTARLWDAATGRAITPTLKHEGDVQLASFSPDGQHVVTVSGGTARLWDAATGEELKKVTISPD